MTALQDLIAVLEGEVQLGETLLLNLAAQKEAILAWNSLALLSHIEEKERLVRQLTEMEEQRRNTVRQLLRAYDFPAMDDAPALKALLSHLPPAPQKASLDRLQQRAWRVYSRLRAGEKHLANLMGVLLNHLGEALGALTPPRTSLYGGTGALTALRPEPGFVQEKI